MRWATSLAAVALMLAALAPGAVAAATAVRIPYQAVGIGVTPLWTALEYHLFARYGIDAETEYVSQSPVLVASMVAGDVPFAIAGEAAVIGADLKGGDIAILASGPARLVFTIYGEKSLHAPTDLKGKRIGVSQFGATTDFIARYVLKAAGLAPERDATILPMGSQASNLRALAAGAIDAAVLAPPTTFKAKEQGFVPVADMADYDLPFYTSPLVAKRSWVKAHPEAALAVVKGYVAGVAKVRTDKAAALAALGKYSHTTDRFILDSSYDALLKVLPKDPLPQAAALRTGLEASKVPGAKTADPARFIDPSFVAQLERSGFIAALYK